MIVVDTNIIVYLYIPSPHSQEVKELLRQDSKWAAPALWRSELINVLSTFMRRKDLTLSQSLEIFELAEQLLSRNTYSVAPLKVLEISQRTACTGYDSEFVCLAEDLQTKLLTYDTGILSKVPDIACEPSSYLQ